MNPPQDKMEKKEAIIRLTDSFGIIKLIFYLICLATIFIGITLWALK